MVLSYRRCALWGHGASAAVVICDSIYKTETHRAVATVVAAAAAATVVAADDGHFMM